MANENEHDKRDTLAGISAEMRSYGERPPPRLMWLEIADRIDAIDSAGAWRSMCTLGNAAALRDALELAIDMPNWCCAKTDDPLECNDYRCVYQDGNHGKAGVDCPWKKIRAALAKPARNCDRFADETDAQIAFLNEVWLISVTKETALERDRFENWTDEMKSTYAKWLLAPAAERKGEGDGRQ